jgi:type IV fimbrial biogenesis protein FimT
MNERKDDLKRPNRGARGFSLIELLVVVAVVMIISGVALPGILQAYRSYQVGSAGNQVSDVLKFTRYEAVRRNTLINCLVRQNAGVTTVWADSNSNGALDNTEKVARFAGNVNLVAAGGVPFTAALATAAGIPALTSISNTNGTVQFDQRGALNPAGAYVLYVGNTGAATAGYRAIILLPSGSTQMWTGDTAGHWALVY